PEQLIASAAQDATHPSRLIALERWPKRPARAMGPKSYWRELCVARHWLMLRHYRHETSGLRGGCARSARRAPRAACARAGRYAGGARRDPTPAERGVARAGDMGCARGRPVPATRRVAQGAHLRVLAAGGSSDAPLDAMALYRSIAGPAADALRKFAPDMTLSLDQANVEVGAGFALSDLRARARTDGSGVTLDLAGASTLWKQLSAALRVEYADLAARGSLALDGLALAADLPPATLRAKLRTDGRSALECEFDASLGALVPAAKGRLLLPAGMPPQVAGEVGDVDLA